jgi:hypothetical protein
MNDFDTSLLTVEKQFEFRKICMQIDDCNDVKELKELLKKVSLLYFGTQCVVMKLASWEMK